MEENLKDFRISSAKKVLREEEEEEEEEERRVGFLVGMKAKKKKIYKIWRKLD